MTATTIRILALPYGETWQRWAEAVKQNLEEVGINVELVARTSPAGTRRQADRDFDIAFTYLYQYGDPALGVSRSYLAPTSPRAALEQRRGTTRTPRWTRCSRGG